VTRSLVRWLIVILLAANLVLFYWLRTETRQIVDTVPAGVKRLVLLEELLPPVVAIDKEFAESTESVEVAAATVDTAITEETTEADAESNALVQVAQGFTEQAREIAGSVMGRNTCWLAGPLDKAPVRRALANALKSRNIPLNLVLQRMTVTPNYWVYLPVNGDSQQQQLLAAELRQKGIDSFSITEGRLSGDLSLGLFRSEDHAHTLMTIVREQGYMPQIYERSRSREEVWAALKYVEVDALGWTAQTGPLADYPSVRLVERACPDS
jgi:hypothetical protein